MNSNSWFYELSSAMFQNGFDLNCFNLASRHRSIYFRRVKLKTFIVIYFVLLSSLVSCSGKHSQMLLSGVLETDDYDLTSQISAELRELRVKEGDIVRIGDTLAVLDTTIVAANHRAVLSSVRRARANLADLQAGTDKEKILAAESRLQIAVATLQQGERELTRAKKLHTEGLINDQSLEQIQLNLQTKQNNEKIAKEELADLKRGARTHEIDAAQAVLSQAEAELATYKKQLDNAFITAPTNGIVHLLPFQIGELIPVGRSVATIHATDNLWIKIFIPEDKLNEITLGDSLSFSVDAYTDINFTAVVSHISSTAEFSPRNVQTQDERLNLVFAVKLIVVSGLDKLRAGMPADFEI